jgi:hypothetical protein
VSKRASTWIILKPRGFTVLDTCINFLRDWARSYSRPFLVDSNMDGKLSKG